MREIWSEDNFKFASRDKTPQVKFEEPVSIPPWVAGLAVVGLFILGLLI